MTRWIDLEGAAERICAAGSLFVPGGMSEPRALWQAVRRRATAADGNRLAGRHVVETRLPGFRDESYDDLECEVTVFFLPRELETAYRRGRVRFLPMHYRDSWDWLRRTRFDVAMIEVTAPDADGQVAPGLTWDFLPAALEGAETVVAQVNRALPTPAGAPRLELDRVDWAVEVDEPPRCSTTTEPDETSVRIAQRVAELVPDGACLQTGIGALPEAVLVALAGHRRLGVHSGMIGDGVRRLVEQGVVTGEAKAIDRGQVVTGFAFGSPDLYRWLQGTGSVSFRPVDYTHDPTVLARLDGFTAINSALEVDLFGQVNAECVRGRPVSGTGGAVDFARGAARAAGGRSIVALPATAARGSVSRIVPALGRDTPTTVLRTDVHWVVTEHGAAELWGRSVEERARALVAIAAPEHREALERSWRELADGG